MSEYAYSSQSPTVPFHGPSGRAPTLLRRRRAHHFPVLRPRACPQRKASGPYRLPVARINTPIKVGRPKHPFTPPYRPGVCQPLRQTLRPDKPSNHGSRSDSGRCAGRFPRNPGQHAPRDAIYLKYKVILFAGRTTFPDPAPSGRRKRSFAGCLSPWGRASRLGRWEEPERTVRSEQPDSRGIGSSGWSRGP